MDLRYCRSYAGRIRLVVVDLAGTVVDYGSCAPAGVFVELFRRHGIEATDEQARGPMGMHKRAHIQTMAQMPDIRSRWLREHGRECTETDIDAMYAEFIPLQVAALGDYGDAIPGAVEFVTALQAQGVKVATTTGYNREMTDIVLADLARQGLVPDVSVCAEDVASGRPAPWMIFRSMELAGVYPREAVLTIGDTLADISAGLNAGVWTVGVAKTGNMLGLSEAETNAVGDEELHHRLAAAYKAMYEAGAHLVADAVADCLPVPGELEQRMRAGQTP